MSRRESRDSEPKRDRSRFDRESSPKRSRRDAQPEAEGVLLSKKDFDVSTETDKKPRQSLRDPAPLEPDSQGLTKDDDKKTTKRAPHLSEGPRSRPYHQHDDRRTTGRGDRRPTPERGSWRGSRDQSNRRAGDDRRDQDKSTWRHDKFREGDDTKGALSRKRPAFREKKIPEESRNGTDRTRTEEAKDTNLNTRRQNERNWRSNNNERPAMGRDRVWNRDDGSRQSYRADREVGFNRNGRSGFHGSWTKAEKKWDHDLYEEANKSPGRANEEEQIAKVEALLAS
ncbi:cyclin-related [Raphanus sativus]|nr:cyclin-related [Raphanus sativus]